MILRVSSVHVAEFPMRHTLYNPVGTYVNLYISLQDIMSHIDLYGTRESDRTVR